jgi:anoctamin-1
VKTGLAEGQKSNRSYYQWVKDFKLVEWGPQGLFPEYLEMGMLDK